MAKQKIVIIVGPTASGKSAFAVALARKYNGEIVSADSRQVYRELNIGAGKISKKEMLGIPHHLLDVASPKKKFSASDFVSLGKKALQNISVCGKLPIIVGGTGYYIDALTCRIAVPNVEPNARLRTKLEKKSPAQLFAMLQRKDSVRAKTIEPHHKRRLIRALEIIEALGHVPTPRLNLGTYDTLWIGINPSRNSLDKKITARLATRIQAGMIQEGQRLHTAGLSYKRMQELGLEYRALARLLRKEITREEFKKELFTDIRRYSKKQIAYWKRNHDIKWFSTTDNRAIASTVRIWLKK